jgi:hypothetical protein
MPMFAVTAGVGAGAASSAIATQGAAKAAKIRVFNNGDMVIPSFEVKISFQRKLISRMRAINI